MQGTITKGISGFYYVAAGDGNVYECKARGIFKKRGMTPLAGDRVEISLLGQNQGWVEEIFPRKNMFIRPPVANVETILLVTAAKDPDSNFDVLDKFCVAGEVNKAEIIICVTKTDLAQEEDLKAFSDRYSQVYPVLFVCCNNGDGLDDVKAKLSGKQVALAGPSGVGKSTLTNLLIGSDLSQTGEISERLMRGKNTTRHSELFKADGFYLFDTPGFTSFDVPEIEEDELAYFFPEFRPFIGTCRFSDCKHIKEPDCAVTAALAAGKINQGRYNSYLGMLSSIRERNKY